MKKVIDTNPIITACILKGYKERIVRYLQDSDSLTVLTIYNEIQDKLLMLHTAFLGLESEKDKNQFLSSKIFRRIEETSAEISDFIKNLDDNTFVQLSQKIQRSIGVLLSKMARLRRYPDDDKKKHQIIQSQKKHLLKKLPKIKENDLNHLYLMYDYTQNFASNINFYTEDKKDYLNNKKKIEAVLKEIKILDFLKF